MLSRALKNMKRRLRHVPSSIKTSSSESKANVLQEFTPAEKRCKKSQDLRYSLVLADADVQNYKIEESGWDVRNADLYLRVENSLFPVHRSRIALSSPILRTIFVSIGYHDEGATIISIGELDVYKMKQLLGFIYFPERKVNDRTLKECLFLAEEFMVEGLKKKCERFLMTSLMMKPIEQIVFAGEHKMVDLMNHGIRRTVNSVDFQSHPLFETLDQKLQQTLINKSKKVRLTSYGPKSQICHRLTYNRTANFLHRPIKNSSKPRKSRTRTA